MHDTLDFRLLNEFQRDFPLLSRPYAALAERLGSTEAEVIAALARLREQGMVSRIGAVIAPRRVGASTLGALAVPADRLEHIADLVSRHPEVNHNYQREHRYNLWFVATVEDEKALAAVLHGIEMETGYGVMSLPLLEGFHIDLGFDMTRMAKSHGATSVTVESPESSSLSEAERRLLSALQNGLELLPRPYSRLARRAGLGENEVLDLIEDWLRRGFVKRFGVVVRHHELGYTANAMCVWDVPDAQVAEIGARLAAEPDVTLCYRRARAQLAAEWPYNLFCMIHGHDRAEVESVIAALSGRHGLSAYPHAVLFSLRRFKQRGARYIHDAAHA
ncbi:MAG: Lrp/AsnC family transcriptional regulator [Proteobacteria bacterium]|nr:Lrp/AsnC family transcriptional regulator [Pseudomonadota bacterium]